MRRRHFLSAGLATAGAAALPAHASDASLGAAFSRVRPDTPGWPTKAEWAQLRRAVGGRLAPVALPDLSSPGARAGLSNPFYLADQPGLTESSGWLDGWRSSPSAYAVDARTSADVSAAVNFAREKNLRLVIKGRGHSYLGQSNAPDSLLVWLRHMDDVVVHDEFRPAGSDASPVPAVSCGGGATWLHAYEAVTGKGGRYVQGGGCTTVGVAGLVQGGGFGTFSKGFGTAGASLLEAEIVTADGHLRVVNSVREPELFWALKGGGGGSFGVLTRITLATHDLPSEFGAAQMTILAHSNEAFRRLIAGLVGHYATSLFNRHWGGEISATPFNVLRIDMAFQGLTADAARAAWSSFVDFVTINAADYHVYAPLRVVALPARDFWNAEALRRFAPTAVQFDPREGASATDFWWSGNTEEAGTFWHAYTSAWLPASLLKPENQSTFVDAWFSASRHWDVAFHLNKGLAGAPESALAATRDTPMNPDATDAFALAIVAANGPQVFGGLPHDLASARARATQVQAAMKALRAAAPNTGAYVNECDYFQEDWQRAFWGPNYRRLLAVKRRYDPEGLFTVHHGVGSEGWSADGFTRT